MNLQKKYQDLADEYIHQEKLSKNPKDRLSLPAKNLLKKPYVIDVHTHFFDTKCINKLYFVTRLLRDVFTPTRTVRGKQAEYPEDMKKSTYVEGWEEDFAQELEKQKQEGKIRVTRSAKGYALALKFLFMTDMKKVYEHYIDNYSAARAFPNIPDSNVLTTALMMDLKHGWGVDVGKNITTQIDDLKNLSSEYPVLPFLFCDPRRADDTKDNLYELFNRAFCQGQSFFGIKLYPGLGYHPYDVRLWPIYRLCEEYNIPILTHCGGSTITADQRKLVIYDGDETKDVSGTDRKDLANQLNAPETWIPVLKKFPKLRLNLAHFGGGETWSTKPKKSKNKYDIFLSNRKSVITAIIKQQVEGKEEKSFENVYADFSYNLTEDEYSRNLKKALINDEDLANRTMFGSDFWVVIQEGDLDKEQQKFVKTLKDKELINKLFIENPYRYLFGEEVGEAV